MDQQNYSCLIVGAIIAEVQASGPTARFPNCSCYLSWMPFWLPVLSLWHLILLIISCVWDQYTVDNILNNLHSNTQCAQSAGQKIASPWQACPATTLLFTNNRDDFYKRFHVKRLQLLYSVLEKHGRGNTPRVIWQHTRNVLSFKMACREKLKLKKKKKKKYN